MCLCFYVIQRSRSDSDKLGESFATPTGPSTQQVRQNVKKALTEGLLKRSQQVKEEFSNLTKEKIESLAKTIEEAMFTLHRVSSYYFYLKI